MSIAAFLRFPKLPFLAQVFALAMTALLTTLPATLPARAQRVEIVRSPGGIEAWFVRQRGLPIVAIEFALLGGSAQDPAAKPGVTNFAVSLLDEGAGDLDAKAFQRRMEETAVELSFEAGADQIYGHLRALSENRDEAFDLLRLALTAPRFDTEAVERIRTQLLTSLRRAETEPNSIAARTYIAAAFPNHPYGRPRGGTLETVPQITQADLKAIVGKTFARDGLKIAVVGDMEPAALGLVLDKIFGALPAKAALDKIPPITFANTGTRKVVNLAVPQTVMLFGGPGVLRHDPDFIPAFVLNHILGGGTFSSRLYREVREKRGLAYSVYTSLAALKACGYFQGGVATRNDAAAETVKIIQEQINDLAANGPTQEELDAAKAYLKGSFPLRFDTSGKIAGQLVQLQLDGFTPDYLEKRNALIDAVTLDDLKRVAKRLYGDGKVLTIAVGQPAGLPSVPAGN